MTTYPIQGVTADVNERMEAVQANMLAEDNMLLRTCEHGIAHPVGRLQKYQPLTDEDRQKRHTQRVDGLVQRCACDGCCEAW